MTTYPPNPLPFEAWAQAYRVGSAYNKNDPRYMDWQIRQAEHERTKKKKK